jgi:hypothetical protein
MVVTTLIAKPCFGFEATLASIKFVTIQGIGELNCISTIGMRVSDWIVW